jgi:hypothetical protein
MYIHNGSAVLIPCALLNFSRKRRAFYATLEAGMDAEEMTHYAKAEQTIRAKITAQEGDLLKKILAGGVEKGELRALDRQELDGLILVLLSGIHGLKRELMADNNFRRVEPAIDILTRTIIHGLAG